jgi:peroxiredoxin
MRISTTILLFVIAISASAKKTTVTGKFINSQYYDTVMLAELSHENPNINKAKLSDDGSFTIKLEVKSTNFFQLALDERTYVMLIIEPGQNIAVSADATDIFGKVEISGSPQTEKFYAATKVFNGHNSVRDSLALAFKRENERLDKIQTEYAKSFISENISSLASLMVIDKLLFEDNTDIYMQLEKSLSAAYPANKIVADFSADIIRQTAGKEGMPVPDISLSDAEGNIVKLSSLKGKVVLIDFWATWCMPCKAEIPVIKRAYGKYKDLGFEVYAVSIDRDKNRWLAEEKDLPWINVFDQGGEVANVFGVKSIPFTLLIGKDGKVAARNVKGNELDSWVPRLLAQ